MTFQQLATATQTRQPAPSAGLDISTTGNSNNSISAISRLFPPEVAFQQLETATPRIREKRDKLASQQVASQFSKVDTIAPCIMGSTKKCAKKNQKTHTHLKKSLIPGL
jgi:hypothetical protein